MKQQFEFVKNQDKSNSVMNPNFRLNSFNKQLIFF